MQFDAGLTGDAATLRAAHAATARASAGDASSAFILVELQKWPTLFAPSNATSGPCSNSSRASAEAPELPQAMAGIARVETGGRLRPDRARQSRALPGRRAGAAAQARLLPAGGRRSTSFFQTLEPAIDATALPAGRAAPPRGPALRQRHRDPARQAVEPLQGQLGVRVPLRLAGTRRVRGVPARAVRRTRRRRTALLHRRRRRRGSARRLDRRIARGAARAVRRGERTPATGVGRAGSGPAGRGSITGLSYDRLRDLPRRADARALQQDPERRREPAGVRRLRARA